MKSLLAALSICLTLSAAAEEAKVSVLDLNFAVPAPWKVVEPSSSMRKAQLEYPITGLDAPLSAVFFHFPGGDVPQNVERWKAQVQGEAAKVEEVEVNGRKVTFFHAVGTYTDPFSGLGAQENHAVLGALIPVEGSGPITIKLAGPKDAVASITQAFRKMATSPFEK
jgi:hypothetical protein